MKTKRFIIILGIIIVAGLILYFAMPRMNISESTKAINENNKKVEKNKGIDQSFIAKISVKNKIDTVYVYDNASEETLFNKGAGVERDVSTPIHQQDYTFIKGHVETVFKNLDKVNVGDVIEVELKNKDKYSFKVTRTQDKLKYAKDNDKIYTTTKKVGISLSTCSKHSKIKQNPELVLVVDAILI